MPFFIAQSAMIPEDCASVQLVRTKYGDLSIKADVLDSMDAWNTKHHGESGLTAKIPGGSVARPRFGRLTMTSSRLIAMPAHGWLPSWLSAKGMASPPSRKTVAGSSSRLKLAPGSSAGFVSA